MKTLLQSVKIRREFPNIHTQLRNTIRGHLALHINGRIIPRTHIEDGIWRTCYDIVTKEQ